MDRNTQLKLSYIAKNTGKKASERLGALTTLILEQSTNEDDTGTSVRHLLSLTCSAVVLQSQVLEEIRDAIQDRSHDREIA